MRILLRIGMLRSLNLELVIVQFKKQTNLNAEYNIYLEDDDFGFDHEDWNEPEMSYAIAA